MLFSKNRFYRQAEQSDKHLLVNGPVNLMVDSRGVTRPFGLSAPLSAPDSKALDKQGSLRRDIKYSHLITYYDSYNDAESEPSPASDYIGLNVIGLYKSVGFLSAVGGEGADFSKLLVSGDLEKDEGFYDGKSIAVEVTNDDRKSEYSQWQYRKIVHYSWDSDQNAGVFELSRPLINVDSDPEDREYNVKISDIDCEEGVVGGKSSGKNKLILDPSASTDVGSYRLKVIRITAGVGKGQARIIADACLNKDGLVEITLIKPWKTKPKFVDDTKPEVQQAQAEWKNKENVKVQYFNKWFSSEYMIYDPMRHSGLCIDGEVTSYDKKTGLLVIDGLGNGTAILSGQVVRFVQKEIASEEDSTDDSSSTDAVVSDTDDEDADAPDDDDDAEDEKDLDKQTATSLVVSLDNANTADDWVESGGLIDKTLRITSGPGSGATYVIVAVEKSGENSISLTLSSANYADKNSSAFSLSGMPNASSTFVIFADDPISSPDLYIGSATAVDIAKILADSDGKIIPQYPYNKNAGTNRTNKVYTDPTSSDNFVSTKRWNKDGESKTCDIAYRNTDNPDEVDSILSVKTPKHSIGVIVRDANTISSILSSANMDVQPNSVTDYTTGTELENLAVSFTVHSLKNPGKKSEEEKVFNFTSLSVLGHHYISPYCLIIYFSNKCNNAVTGSSKKSFTKCVLSSNKNKPYFTRSGEENPTNTWWLTSSSLVAPYADDTFFPVEKPTDPGFKIYISDPDALGLNESNFVPGAYSLNFTVAPLSTDVPDKFRSDTKKLAKFLAKHSYKISRPIIKINLEGDTPPPDADPDDPHPDYPSAWLSPSSSAAYPPLVPSYSTLSIESLRNPPYSLVYYAPERLGNFGSDFHICYFGNVPLSFLSTWGSTASWDASSRRVTVDTVNTIYNSYWPNDPNSNWKLYLSAPASVGKLVFTVPKSFGEYNLDFHIGKLGPYSLSDLKDKGVSVSWNVDTREITVSQLLYPAHGFHATDNDIVEDDVAANPDYLLNESGLNLYIKMDYASRSYKIHCQDHVDVYTYKDSEGNDVVYRKVFRFYVDPELGDDFDLVQYGNLRPGTHDVLLNHFFIQSYDPKTRIFTMDCHNPGGSLAAWPNDPHKNWYLYLRPYSEEDRIPPAYGVPYVVVSGNLPVLYLKPSSDPISLIPSFRTSATVNGNSLMEGFYTGWKLLLFNPDNDAKPKLKYKETRVCAYFDANGSVLPDCKLAGVGAGWQAVLYSEYSRCLGSAIAPYDSDVFYAKKSKAAKLYNEFVPLEAFSSSEEKDSETDTTPYEGWTLKVLSSSKLRKNGTSKYKVSSEKNAEKSKRTIVKYFPDSHRAYVFYKEDDASFPPEKSQYFKPGLDGSEHLWLYDESSAVDFLFNEDSDSGLTDERSEDYGCRILVTNIRPCALPGVDKIRLYRATDIAQSYHLVATLENKFQEYEDNIPEEELTRGVDYGNTPPPPCGCVTNYKGLFALGGVPDSVCFSGTDGSLPRIYPIPSSFYALYEQDYEHPIYEGYTYTDCSSINALIKKSVLALSTPFNPSVEYRFPVVDKLKAEKINVSFLISEPTSPGLLVYSRQPVFSGRTQMMDVKLVDGVPQNDVVYLPRSASSKDNFYEGCRLTITSPYYNPDVESEVKSHIFSCEIKERDYTGLTRCLDNVHIRSFYKLPDPAPARYPSFPFSIDRLFWSLRAERTDDGFVYKYSDMFGHKDVEIKPTLVDGPNGSKYLSFRFTAHQGSDYSTLEYRLGGDLGVLGSSAAGNLLAFSFSDTADKPIENYLPALGELKDERTDAGLVMTIPGLFDNQRSASIFTKSSEIPFSRSSVGSDDSIWRIAVFDKYISPDDVPSGPTFVSCKSNAYTVYFCSPSSGDTEKVTLANTFTFADDYGDRITGLVGLPKFIAVFKERAVYALDPFEPSLVLLNREIGCAATDSIASGRGGVYWFSADRRVLRSGFNGDAIYYASKEIQPWLDEECDIDGESFDPTRIKEVKATYDADNDEYMIAFPTKSGKWFLFAFCDSDQTWFRIEDHSGTDELCSENAFNCLFKHHGRASFASDYGVYSYSEGERPSFYPWKYASVYLFNSNSGMRKLVKRIQVINLIDNKLPSDPLPSAYFEFYRNLSEDPEESYQQEGRYTRRFFDTNKYVQYVHVGVRALLWNFIMFSSDQDKVSNANFVRIHDFVLHYRNKHDDEPLWGATPFADPPHGTS